MLKRFSTKNKLLYKYKYLNTRNEEYKDINQYNYDKTERYS